MRRFSYSVILTLFLPSCLFAQSIRETYNSGYDTLLQMLEGNGSSSFKKAVFTTENCFLQNQMSYAAFEDHIAKLVIVLNGWMNANRLQNYRYPDSLDLQKNLAIYKFLKDTVKIEDNQGKMFLLLPYTYDFTDFMGREDWRCMFVTKLLATKKGNCHSLPYLYKILADELGASCWLSLAPNHIYIKNRSKKIGWYNTELTSGTFPIDAWITTPGYIPIKAVQSGLYMDTLSNQQAISLCVLDLAKGYESQTHNYTDGFILKCCDLVLKYHPVNAQALLLKAETTKRIYEQEKTNGNDPITIYREMELLYTKLFDLGYREMPEKMYVEWIKSMATEKEKYSNTKIGEVIKGK